MTDKRTTPEGTEGMAEPPRPKKRAVPTIDLTATEVKAAATAGDPPRAQAAEADAAVESSDDSYKESSSDSWSWLSASISGPALAAGAAIMTLVLAGLWLAGLVPPRYSEPGVVRAVDTKVVDALNGRIAKIEGSITKLPPDDASVNERLAAADNAMKSLGLALAALNRRSDDIAANTTAARERAEAAEKAVAELRSSVQIAATASAGLSAADLDVLQKRVAAIEQSAKAATTDMPARLALSAAALRDAALSGAPFAAQLAQAKSLGADDKFLAPLEPFAAVGVPTPATLAQELRALLPAMLKLSGALAPDGGFLEKLQANAGKLVRIRPVDAPPGDDSSAVLARIEIAAADNDIGGALNDLNKLPEASRAPALAWIAKAKERQAALTAARAFAAESARALGKP
jgi:hypothetical protein